MQIIHKQTDEEEIAYHTAVKQAVGDSARSRRAKRTRRAPMWSGRGMGSTCARVVMSSPRMRGARAAATTRPKEVTRASSALGAGMYAYERWGRWAEVDRRAGGGRAAPVVGAVASGDASEVVEGAGSPRIARRGVRRGSSDAR